MVECIRMYVIRNNNKNEGKNMEIMSLAIAVFAVIIGLVIGYVSISAKMKSSQEAAELMLLNAEQEATNLRGQAEREGRFTC